MKKYLIEDELKIEKEITNILIKKMIKNSDSDCPPKRFRPQECLDGKKVSDKRCVVCFYEHARQLAISRLEKQGVKLRELLSNNK